MPSFTKATASLLLASSVSARTIVQPDVYSKLSEGHNKLREFFQGWSVDESHFAKEGNALVGMDGKSYRALMPDSVRAKSARRFASKDVSSLPFLLRWQSKCCCLNPFTESEADYDVVPMEIGTDNKLIARGDDGLPALLSEKAWNGYQGLQGKNKAKKHFLARYIPVKETHKDANTTSSIGYWEKLSQKEIEASRDENDCKWYGALTGCCCTAFSAIGMFLQSRGREVPLRREEEVFLFQLQARRKAGRARDLPGLDVERCILLHDVREHRRVPQADPRGVKVRQRGAGHEREQQGRGLARAAPGQAG